MQVCRKIKGLIVLLTVLFVSPVFAESIEMPEMPSMPEISNPSLDGSFYRPSIPKQPKKSSVEEVQTLNNSTNSILTDGKNSTDLISSFLGSNQNLTANDISTLYDSGMFSSLSSLSNVSSIASLTNTDTTNQLLQQVLASLNELKAEQKKASLQEQTTLSNYQQDSKIFKQREPSILRFKINGYSVTESFTKVFFSEPENDGTFLLSADRKYYANQKPREETVYLLFRAVKSRGTSTVYTVQPSVVQTEKNDNSYIYKLSQIKNLTAEKTGNLVVMHNSDGDVVVDILLDIDSK